MTARPITFLSDYGHEDEFAGVCRAVIARVAPDARVIDITHGIQRHGVRHGAVVLANSLPFAPPGIHLAIVDPDVGSDRRSVAVRTAEDRILVGPDNGLLSPALRRFGGARDAVDISDSPFRLEPLSATFHGRDLFAPVAARLASGADLEQAGEPLEPATLVNLDLPTARIRPDRLVAHVVYLDRFGNAILDAGPAEVEAGPLKFGDAVRVKVGRRRAVQAHFGRTFADVDENELLLYEDSTRSLALAVNRGKASEQLKLKPDTEVVLEAAD
jgi:S-adenosylmethionine hydrolase